MVRLQIDSSQLAVHAARLQTIHKSALPVAVRNTLNKAAFDVKTDTMPSGVKKTFIQREQAFFKANSKVVPATGFSIQNMAAIVGFVPLKQVPVKNRDLAVQDLEEQEKGGKIGGRTFVPINAARVSSSYRRRVKQKFRLNQIGDEMFDSENSNLKGANGEENFTLSAIYAGKGGFVMGNKTNKKNNRFLYYINSVTRVKKTMTTKSGRVVKKGNTIVNATAIYSIKKGRSANIKETHFMRKASLQSADKMNAIFIEEAKKQIKKYM